MAKEFVRNIKNTKLDSNEELKEPLYTNVQNDLLSDKKHAYIRNNDFYFPITKSILNVTEDSNIKNPLEYTKVIDGRTNEVTSHWNFNKLNNNFESTLPITKSTNNETITYGLSYPSLFNHFKFDNVFLSASQDGDDIKIKFSPDVIYEKTNQDMINKLEYLEQNMGQNLTNNFREEFNKKIDDKFKDLEKQSKPLAIKKFMLANKINVEQNDIIDDGDNWAVPLQLDTDYYLVWQGEKISFTKNTDKDDNEYKIDISKLNNNYNLLVNTYANKKNNTLIYHIKEGKILISKYTIDEYLELERTAIIVNMKRTASTGEISDIEKAILQEMGKRIDEYRDKLVTVENNVNKAYSIIDSLNSTNTILMNRIDRHEETLKNINSVIQQHSQDIINLSKRISG